MFHDGVEELSVDVRDEQRPHRASMLHADPPHLLTWLLTYMQCCCTQPKTGFYRDGFCNTGPNDVGAHVVCSRVTKEFLEYSASRGNNLMQAHPPMFPGLKPGDRCGFADAVVHMPVPSARSCKRLWAGTCVMQVSYATPATKYRFQAKQIRVHSEFTRSITISGGLRVR